MNTDRRYDMRYQTSFNLHSLMYAKLAKASSRTGISMQDLVIQMMYTYAKDHNKMQVEEGTVRYQRYMARGEWHKFRVALYKKDYELFTDMRKVMKKSVSLLISLAIKKYLDTIITKILKQIFKYTYLIHDSSGKKVKGIKEWLLKWNLLKEKNKMQLRT